MGHLVILKVNHFLQILSDGVAIDTFYFFLVEF